MKRPTTDRPLAANRTAYDALVAVAEERLRAGDAEGVLHVAATAATLAWGRPVGLLADPHLESLVVRAVRGDRPAPTVDRTRATGRVLHVLTEAYALGGHSRFAWRWIERDGRRADAVLTASGGGDVPAPLVEAVRAVGGTLHVLARPDDTLLGRAEALAALVADADVVVLHTHPHDVVALAALHLADVRPPVVTENHADHAYWLGLAASDVVVNHREVGARLCAEGRGVPAERLRQLPLPIAPVPGPNDRGPVRTAMRIGPDTPVAICVASAHKLRPLFGVGFDRVLDAVLAAVPELVVLMIGADGVEPWPALAARYPGRLVPLGVVHELSRVFAAADIYLDSFPVSGGTTVLEAAASGLPVLCLQQTESYSDVWASQSPGLADPANRVGSVAQLIDAVRTMVRMPKDRRRRGVRTRNAVLRAHRGDAWRAALTEVYEAAFSLPAMSLEQLGEGRPEPAYVSELVEYSQPLTLEPPAELAVQMPFGVVPPVGLTVAVLRTWLTALSPDGPVRLRIRARPDWVRSAAWTRRMLELTSASRSLALSLTVEPAEAEQALAVLLERMAEVGVDPDSCGHVSLDAVGDAPAAQELMLACDAWSVALAEAFLEAAGELTSTAGRLASV